VYLASGYKTEKIINMRGMAIVMAIVNNYFYFGDPCRLVLINVGINTNYKAITLGK